MLEQEARQGSDVENESGAPALPGSYSDPLNSAQAAEATMVLKLLHDLCSLVPVYPWRHRRGPKPLSRGEQIYCMGTKVYFCRSARRSLTFLEDAVASGRVSRVPSFNTLLGYFGSQELTLVLRRLIRLSTLPLRGLETRFALDATPLAMNSRLDYSGTYTANRCGGYRYITLHTIEGIDTHLVTAVAVDVCLDQYFHMTHDSQFFERLVRNTFTLGFHVRGVWGDKGYSSESNRMYLESICAENHLTENRNRRGGKAIERDPLARQRNAAETVFSMIKQIFGGKVRSKKETSLVNEAMTIVLMHNLRVLVQQHFRRGITPDWTSSEDVWDEYADNEHDDL